jgi:hypothetical protein
MGTGCRPKLPLLPRGRGTLKLFLIDPQGIDVLNKVGPQEGAPDARILRDRLFQGLYGASRRPLRAIFTNDKVENKKLFSFFDDSAFQTRIVRPA